MKNSRRGQSALELSLIMFLFLSMLSITYNAVMAFSIHQYFSYAAFMSARALQASGLAPQDQNDRAVQALRRYIPTMGNNLQADAFIYKVGGRALATDIVANIVPNPGSTPPASGFPSEGNNNQGVIIRFKVPFVQLPIGPEMRGALQELDMQVVSYLGREPTVTECRNFFSAFFSTYGGGGGRHSADGMDDSGC